MEINNLDEKIDTLCCADNKNNKDNKNNNNDNKVKPAAVVPKNNSEKDDKKSLDKNINILYQAELVKILIENNK